MKLMYSGCGRRGLLFARVRIRGEAYMYADNVSYELHKQAERNRQGQDARVANRTPISVMAPTGIGDVGTLFPAVW